jgi:hypothetical protein
MRQILEGDTRPGSSITVAIPEMVNKVYDIVMTYRKVQKDVYVCILVQLID